MDLQEIKNKYAQEQGYEDWEQLDILSGREEITKHIDEICIRAQKEALEKAAENAEIDFVFIPFEDFDPIVKRTSITNPENLII